MLQQSTGVEGGREGKPEGIDGKKDMNKGGEGSSPGIESQYKARSALLQKTNIMLQCIIQKR